nr:two-component sensor histidine kinase BarA [Paraferrimonas haliotis]
MKSNYSLRTWVLLLALAPSILLGVMLGGYFSNERIENLDHALKVQAMNIIEPLALASEAGFTYSNREHIKRIINMAHQRQSELVKSIAVFTEKNILHVTTSYHRDFELMRLPAPVRTLDKSEVQHIGTTMIVRSPIFSPDYDHSGPARTQDIIGYVSMDMNKEHVLLEQHKLAITTFVIILIGIQLNLFFSFKLVRGMTRPIQEMVTQMDAIRRGQLASRVEGETIGELEELRLGINGMAQTLGDYHREVQASVEQATSDMRQTIEQVEIQNIELDIAKRKAETASQIKTDFLANMSHELRTPLNGIIGFSRQLQKSQLHRSQRDYLRTIEHSASSLLNIINDILDLSKLEADKMAIEHLPFSVYECVEDSLTLLSTAAADKGLELVVDIDPNIPESLSGDAMRLGQILSNLVANAIKFTDEGVVRIQVEQLEQKGDRLSIKAQVHDSGIGISAAQQEKLFQAFNQADSSISRKYGGTGLGLVICRRLVKKMGGEIGFSSKPDVGSTFWFTLPLTTSPYAIRDLMPTELLQHKSVLLYQPLAQTRKVMEKALNHYQLAVTSCPDLDSFYEHINKQQSYDFIISACCETAMDKKQEPLAIQQLQALTPRLIITHGNQNLESIEPLMRNNADNLLAMPIVHKRLLQCLLYPNGEPSESHEAKSAPHDEPSSLYQTMAELRHAKVLAVDDNPSNLKLIKTLLEENVTEVVSVNSGTQAIRECREQAFDVIFMDIQMPGIDGLSATRIIRSNGLNQRTPIIAVTAHTLSEERHKYMQSGMDGYLAKPIMENELVASLSTWLAKGETESKLQLPCIDWKLALSQANNNAELAKEMIQMMLDDLPNAHTNIRRAMTHNDNSLAQQSVHRLHGAACYAGVVSMQRQCADIETQLKQGVTLATLEPEILQLLDEINKVESAAIELLQSQPQLESSRR